MNSTNIDYLKTQLELAVYAAKKAARMLIEAQNTDIIINSNFNRDIKLEADIASEKLIVDTLLYHSSYDILTEESGFIRNTNADGYRWIVDPLDGSLNYSRDIDIYAVSIGLWQYDQPLAGVIYDFLHERLYTGVVGYGAFVNQLPIYVSRISEKNNSILTTGFPVHFNFDATKINTFVSNVQDFKKVRLLGSASMSLAHVARGSVEAYTESNIAIWDVAAGLAIVVAAGGTYTAFQGKDSNYLNVYASNGRIG